MVDPREIESYFDRLWPLHRSITGEGNRKSLRILSEIAPNNILEIQSGSQLQSGWVVPNEWIVNEAYLIGPDGKLVLDIADNLLHLLNYSTPFSGTISRAELDKHLFSRPERPDAIPYVTSYYKERWGFCLSHKQRQQLPDGDYRVVIDTEMVKGSLSVAEKVIKGSSSSEVFFSSFICHPMMANNELAGPIVQAFLAREIASKRRRLTYRFAWHPETIGAIAYLSVRGEHLKSNVIAGYGFCCTGDGRRLVYKKSRRGNTLADRVAELVMSSDDQSEIRDYKPFDGDERQYCSPGYDLPYGCFMHTPPGEYPEYHSSDDDKSLIDFNAISDFIGMMLDVCDALESNLSYKRVDAFCEPKLDRFGLWSDLGVGAAGYKDLQYALLWFLNYADGRNLIDIAKISGQPISLLAEAAKRCVNAGLVRVV